MSNRLAIVTTHPIQYYAPVFRLLAEKMPVKVFYTAGAGKKLDKGFGKNIEWDIPLLEGYDHQFLTNIATDQGTHHFKGIINTDAISSIKAYQPTAILVFGWSNHSHLKILRHFKGKIPIYFRGDSTLLDQKQNIKNVLRSIFLSWVYRHIDYAFYTGSANRQYYLKYGVPEKKLIFAPHAIDVRRFAEDRNEAALAFRSSLGLSDSEILILFAGKLEPKKNPMLLLCAFVEINLANVHLLFVGNGVLENELKDHVKLQVPEILATKIHFSDFQNQSMMPVVYQAANLYCLPSKGPGETWGLAVNEAMAAGTAVLVSDKVGCSTDLVSTAVGAIFKSEDLADLKQKLIILTQSKSDLIDKGKNAAKAIQDWSFERQVSAILAYVNR
ncbi:MAG: glycosyltransferase family 4 protein [Pedobacter sp.]|nr:glycosyltransferase family 4 protein [Pedobacter sp.]MDQ8053940.1 glycosyltransferase family 4 protein [Pedobacter sp.]